MASVAGPAVYVAGSAFVVLAMGLGMTGKAGTLMSVIREWFPSRAHPIVILPRRQAKLVFEPRGSDPTSDSAIALTYLGLSGGQPRFRLQGQAAGRTWREDHIGGGTWTASEAFTRLPDDALAGDDLTVTCLSEDEGHIRLRVTSGLRLRFEGNWATAGLDLAGLIDLDAAGERADADSELLRWMLRRGRVSLSDAAVWAGHPESGMQARLRHLVDSGAVRELHEHGKTVYRANMARRRARHVPDGLEPAAKDRSSSVRAAIRARTDQASEWLHGDRSRRVLEYSPLVAIALVTEWLVITDRASFTGLLSFSGTVAVPVVAGLFPCLLLLSSRHKGDLVPASVSRLPGGPWLASGIYAFFLVSMLLHGLFVWQNHIAQALLLVFVAVALVVSVVAIRRGAFDGRTVVTLRDDRRPDGGAVFEVVSNGVPALAEVRLTYSEGVERIAGLNQVIPDFTSLRKITTTLPPGHESDIKIWANQVSPQGELQGLPAHVRLVSGSEQQRIDLGLAGGTAHLPSEGFLSLIEFELDQIPAPASSPQATTVAKKSPVDVHALLAPSPGNAILSSESS